MKKSFFIFIASIVTLACLAEPVTPDAARAKAQAFLSSRGITLAHDSQLLKAPSVSAQPPYYVFNASENKGFVMIAGDDQTGTVLGYSTQGSFDERHMPDGLRAMLEAYSKRSTTGAGRITTSTRRSIAHEAINPLITSMWDQGEATEEGNPYNMLCPTIDSIHCLAGCVAVAMGQVMRFHQCPAMPCSTIPGYRQNDDTLRLASLPPVTFDWDKMQDLYEGNERQAEKMATARLLRYCSQAIRTQYSCVKSEALGSEAVNALTNYFGYSQHIRYVKRSNYHDDEWDRLIYGELASSRPVIYFGHSTTGGHAFICDGYDGQELYHINWGWGGDYDGYFDLSILCPDGNDYDESVGYSINQHAIIGIAPGPQTTDHIPFSDEHVKATCISLWDTDGDGELSYDEAESVLSLSDAFRGDSLIRRFPELQYFKHLKSIAPSAFNSCKSLESIVIPANIGSISQRAFADCQRLSFIISKNPLPPTCGKDAFAGCHATVYVVKGAKEKYEEASGWRNLTIVETDDDDFLYCNDIRLTKSEGGQLDIGMHNIHKAVGLQLCVQLPEGLSIRTDSTGCYDIQLSDRLPNFEYYCLKQEDSNAYMLLLMSMSLREIKQSEGNLVTIHLEAADSIAAGFYEANFSSVTISAIEDNVIYGLRPLPFSSHIYVTDYYLGDVNCDNIIDVTDVMQIINFVLGNQVEGFNVDNADYDHDGFIDVTDVMLVVQRILNN